MGFDTKKLFKTETKGISISRFIKNNTPQIALLTPFIIAVVSGVGNFYIYTYRKGYYDYFSLGNSFIVFDRTTIIYKLITVSIASLIYWIYSIFSVRMFYKRKNLLLKMVCFFIIPFLLNFIFVWFSSKKLLFSDVSYFIATIIISFVFIFFHWSLIYVMGHFMSGKINNDVIEQYNKENLEKKNVKMQNKENNKKATNIKKNNKFRQKDKGIFAIIIFLGAIVVYIFIIWYSGYFKAKSEKQFDTVKIKNSNYAVIATDGNQFILELCDISKDKKSLIIDTNTYMKVDCKDLIIQRYNFESVLKK